MANTIKIALHPDAHITSCTVIIANRKYTITSAVTELSTPQAAYLEPGNSLPLRAFVGQIQYPIKLYLGTTEKATLATNEATYQYNEGTGKLYYLMGNEDIYYIKDTGPTTNFCHVDLNTTSATQFYITIGDTDILLNSDAGNRNFYIQNSFKIKPSLQTTLPKSGYIWPLTITYNSTVTNLNKADSTTTFTATSSVTDFTLGYTQDLGMSFICGTGLKLVDIVYASQGVITIQKSTKSIRGNLSSIEYCFGLKSTSGQPTAYPKFESGYTYPIYIYRNGSLWKQYNYAQNPTLEYDNGASYTFQANYNGVSYPLQLMANGGIFSDSSSSKIINPTQSGAWEYQLTSEDIPTYTSGGIGYVLTGWKENGSSVREYLPLDNIFISRLTSGLNYYSLMAMWEPAILTTYTITLYEEDGTTVISTHTDTNQLGSYSYTITDTPSVPSGKIFKGWTTELGSGRIDYTPTATITVFQTNPTISLYPTIRNIPQTGNFYWSGVDMATDETLIYGPSTGASETCPITNLTATMWNNFQDTLAIYNTSFVPIYFTSGDRITAAEFNRVRQALADKSAQYLPDPVTNTSRINAALFRNTIQQPSLQNALNSITIAPYLNFKVYADAACQTEIAESDNTYTKSFEYVVNDPETTCIAFFYNSSYPTYYLKYSSSPAVDLFLLGGGGGGGMGMTYSGSGSSYGQPGSPGTASSISGISGATADFGRGGQGSGTTGTTQTTAAGGAGQNIGGSSSENASGTAFYMFNSAANLQVGGGGGGAHSYCASKGTATGVAYNALANNSANGRWANQSTKGNNGSLYGSGGGGLSISINRSSTGARSAAAGGGGSGYGTTLTNVILNASTVYPIVVGCGGAGSYEGSSRYAGSGKAGIILIRPQGG